MLTVTPRAFSAKSLCWEREKRKKNINWPLKLIILNLILRVSSQFKINLRRTFRWPDWNYFLLADLFPFMCRFKWINKLLLMVLIDVRPFTTQRNLSLKINITQRINLFSIWKWLNKLTRWPVYFKIYWVGSIYHILNGRLNLIFYTYIMLRVTPWGMYNTRLDIHTRLIILNIFIRT